MHVVGFAEHDHRACTAEMIEAVERYCAAHKLQFTAIRRRVLEMLLEEHKALGAYDILARLNAEGRSSQPPVAYRALDFLVSNGFAHKIERMNAYIACAHPHERHAPAFMICRVCDSVAEATSEPARGMLGVAAREAGFRIERTVVEAVGVCPACQAAEDA